MAQHPPHARQPAATRLKASGAISGLLFVAAMAAAFWLGAIWTAQPWFN